MNKYDCIFIPGGGLLPDGTLPGWTMSRIERALALQDQTRWIAFLSGGTVHKPPPLNDTGQPIFESRAAARYLENEGLSSKKILTEICSYDTIGNAYFSRLLFSEPLQLRHNLVITSEFHFARTQEAFDWIYGLTPQLGNIEFKYESVPNEGLSTDSLKAREEREKKSLENIQQLRRQIKTLKDCTTWLYTEHNAYNPNTNEEVLSDNEFEILLKVFREHLS